jgi:hypothetical protein
MKKRSPSFLIFFIICSFAYAKPNLQTLSLSKEIRNVDKRPSFQSHPDWVAVPIPFAPIDKFRQKLEAHIEAKLQHRGEAHVTILTPPEWSILSQILKMEDVEKLALKEHLMKKKFKVKCLKKVTATIQGRSEDSWFVALDSPGLKDFRQEVWRLYVARGGSGDDFKWQRWAPHITVGFTARDLHDEDQINKEKVGCAVNINLID